MLQSIWHNDAYRCQEGLGHKTSSCVQLSWVSMSPVETSTHAYEELHFRDLLVHFLHELDDEIHQLVLQHLLGMEVGDEKGDVITLTV
jgi:hypothetical protein